MQLKYKFDFTTKKYFLISDYENNHKIFTFSIHLTQMFCSCPSLYAHRHFFFQYDMGGCFCGLYPGSKF